MSKRARVLALVAVLAGLVFAGMIYGLYFASNPKEIPSVLIGKKVPAFSLKDFSGNPMSEKDLIGSPVIFNFWASWCIPCREEAPLLESVWKAYKDKGLKIIGVASNDETENSLKFLRTYEITYPNLQDLADSTTLIDYGVTGMPETFLINREGVIVKKLIGAVKEKDILDFVEASFK